MKVGVFGALGKMGRTVCTAVEGDPELSLVACVDPVLDGDVSVADVACSTSPDVLVEAGAAVAVDFTRPDAVMDNIRFCVGHGIHAVVGTTGLGQAEFDEMRSLCSGADANVFVAPNFALGAVLMMHFAKQAARYLGSCEVVELHHNQKLDAPSGTAWRTAQEIAGVWREHGRPEGGEAAPGEEEKVAGSRGGDVDGVRVHSLRIQGLVAHQEVVFGAEGQSLSIRHDAIDRSSFMPGVLLAVKKVGSLPGLTVGLEHLLDL